MKTTLLVVISIIPMAALADDPLPKRADFSRYKAMLDRSPFAVATVAVPTATPDFAKDLYLANAARSGDEGFLTLASATDKNFKEYLSTKATNEHGWGVSDIQWSPEMGQTKATITKDGKYATVGFNQSLLSQNNQTPNQPLTNAVQPPMFPGMATPPQPYQKPAPIPSLPPTYQQPIRPTPPQPGQVHQRGVIQRNPTPMPTPIVPPPPAPDSDDSDE